MEELEEMNSRMIIAAIAVVAVAGCVSGPKVDNTPVAALDLNRYLGEWYEIARFDHSFKRGIEQAKANYMLNEDSTRWCDRQAVASGRTQTLLSYVRLILSVAVERSQVCGHLV